MPNGIVLSDLHLFAKRSDSNLIESTLTEIPRNTDFVVLNGDIFDFRWSCFPTAEDTVFQAKEWLCNLKQSLPSSQIYYIMGNHDCSPLWAETLQQITDDKFFWSETHFQIGESLFIHGDLPLEGRNPFYRDLTKHHKRMPAYHMMDFLYETAVNTRLHKLTRFLGSPDLHVSRIYEAIQTHKPEYLDQLKHVYFGHTHAPFSGYEFEGISFYNTGSGIKFMNMNKIDIIHESKEE